MQTVAQELAEYTRQSELFEVIDDHHVRCLSCGQQQRISPEAAWLPTLNLP